MIDDIALGNGALERIRIQDIAVNKSRTQGFKPTEIRRRSDQGGHFVASVDELFDNMRPDKPAGPGH
jgi:hypothetical protein